jgi:trimeric autotransporter adhesin
VGDRGRLGWAALLLLAACLVSCGLLVSFDDVDTSSGSSGASGGGPTYAVRGTAFGLGIARATLVLNGASPITVGDGEFAFKERLADGAAYTVGLSAAVPGHPCTFEREKGIIAGADATDVVVRCPASHDPELVSLLISGGDLAPTFDPKKDGYATTKPLNGVSFFPPRTTTTVTAKARDSGATIKIASAPAVMGAGSANVALDAGANRIDVVVTAADAVAQRHYTIDLSGIPTIDYLKASNTRPGEVFGTSVATSGDTLVIGAYGETSLAKGVNNPPAPYSATDGATGAVYVFTRAGGVWSQQAYLKASNTHDESGLSGPLFGYSVAISGNTIAVGAPQEASNATGVNGNQADASAITAGAAYVFTRVGTTWTQQAYVKASNARPISRFGVAVALSGDTLAVGADAESSNASTVNGDQANQSLSRAGAAYVFTRSGVTWSQQAYIKASNTRSEASFGSALALSGDTLAVGAPYETSSATGVNGSQAATGSNYGAAYVFARSGTTWSQQAYVKASNTRADANFGYAVAVSGDTLAVGSNGESSGVPGDPADTSASNAGAVYVFARAGATWSQQAYVKAAKPQTAAGFGTSVALSDNTLAVGSPYEASNAKGFDGDQGDKSTARAGAAFVFARTGTAWKPRAYFKATNTRAQAYFGDSIALSADTLLIGSPQESSNATGVNGNSADASSLMAGAAYVVP